MAHSTPLRLATTRWVAFHSLFALACLGLQTLENHVEDTDFRGISPTLHRISLRKSSGLLKLVAANVIQVAVERAACFDLCSRAPYENVLSGVSRQKVCKSS